MPNECTRHHAYRMLLKPERDYDSLELEIIKTEGITRIYLNFLHGQFPFNEKQSEAVCFQVFLEEDLASSIELEAFPLKGSQKLMINEKDSLWLLSLLEEGKHPVIQVGYHSLKTKAKKFEDYYKQMRNDNL